jgi:hypothetical protein
MVVVDVTESCRLQVPVKSFVLLRAGILRYDPNTGACAAVDSTSDGKKISRAAVGSQGLRNVLSLTLMVRR